MTDPINNSVIETIQRNADTLVAISAWAAGYRDVGFKASTCMDRIIEVLEKQGYMQPKVKKANRNG